MEKTTIATTNDASVETPASTNWKPYAVGGALLAMLGANAALFVRSGNLEQELKHVASATSTEISGLKSVNAAQAEAGKRTAEQMTAQIEQAQTNAKNFAAAQARHNAERVAKSTTEMVNTLSEQHKAETAKVTAALGEMKQNSESSLAQVNGKVGDVATEVGNVKTELGATKTSLETTIADLKSVRGDLGVQSGLIATNSTELAALRELGDRNFYEFTLSKQAPTATLAGVNMKLRKADLKRNKFNMDLVSDDKRVEKRDKSLHEPVQFYVGGMRQPFEIVVNEISKDKITGYLATPKVMAARR
jgi:hypothetical protein